MSIRTQQTGTRRSPEVSVEHNTWREAVLEDLASEITVGYVGPMASEYVAEGIPFLRSQNVDYLRINTHDLKHITPGFHERLKKSSLSPGDVVIVRTGKPGACAVIPDWLPVANCSDLVIVRCGDNLDPHFLAYYMNSLASHHVAAHLVGAVQQHFNVESARTMRLNLPAIGEQLAIAHTLGSLDDKIDLDKRMNKTLEATGRAIFKRWFIDFEFPNEEGKPYRSSGGEMVYNEELERDIPKGCESKTIEDVVTVKGGSTPSTENAEYWDSGRVNWCTPKDLSALDSPILLDTERKITENGLATISSGLLPTGTVLLSSRAPIGYLAISEIPVAVNQGFIAIVCDKVVSKYFMLLWLQHNMGKIESRAHGTTFQEINKASFRQIRILIPAPDILSRFDELIRPLHSRSVKNEKEVRSLSHLRDSLLPKLMSGKIRVPLEVR